MHQFELGTLLANVGQFFDQALDLGLFLAVSGTDFGELGIRLLQVLSQRVRRRDITLSFDLEHDLDTGCQVRVQKLPLINISRQKDLLVDDEAL